MLAIISKSSISVDTKLSFVVMTEDLLRMDHI